MFLSEVCSESALSPWSCTGRRFGATYGLLFVGRSRRFRSGSVCPAVYRMVNSLGLPTIRGDGFQLTRDPRTFVVVSGVRWRDLILPS